MDNLVIILWGIAVLLHFIKLSLLFFHGLFFNLLQCLYYFLLFEVLEIKPLSYTQKHTKKLQLQRIKNDISIHIK